MLELCQQAPLPVMHAQGLVPFDLANRQGNEEALKLLVNASIAAEARQYQAMPDEF